MENKVWDVIIIGGGPAGYTAALDGVEAARYFAGLQADELINILCEG